MGARTRHIGGKITFYSYPISDTKNQLETNYLNIKTRTIKATKKTEYLSDLGGEKTFLDKTQIGTNHKRKKSDELDFIKM